MEALFALVLAGSQIVLVWGVLLIAVALSALAVLGRCRLAALLRPALVWLGFRTPEVAPPDEPSGEIPRFVASAMDVEQSRGPRHRVQPARHPQRSDDATQVLPRHDLDDTVVFYVVEPVDERERTR